jgi:hypothetical protein
VTERGDIDAVRVLRVHDDASDLARLLEAGPRPRAPSVERAVHPVAVGDVRPHVGLAGPDVEDARIGRRHRDRADRRDRLAVEDRLPRAPGVRRLPDAAADGAEVEMLGLSRHEGDG